jgi:parvulin-like peptidyl-prolyl isomerase
MKRQGLLILFAGLFLFACAGGPEETATTMPEPAAPAVEDTSHLAARVNGTDITKAQVSELVDAYKKEQEAAGTALTAAKEEWYETVVTEGLINVELVKQDAAAKNMNVSDEDLSAATKSLEMAPKAKFPETAEYRAQLGKLLESGGTLAIEGTKLTEYYEKNKEKYFIPDSVDISQIFIPVDTFDAEKGLKDKAAKRKSKQVYKMLKSKGADFAAVAKDHSLGKEAAEGGSLGNVRKGRMGDSFDKVAFKSKPGKFSKPFKTEKGYHIVLVSKRTKSHQKKYIEVKETIQSVLWEAAYKVAGAAYIGELRKGADVKLFK